MGSYTRLAQELVLLNAYLRNGFIYQTCSGTCFVKCLPKEWVHIPDLLRNLSWNLICPHRMLIGLKTKCDEIGWVKRINIHRHRNTRNVLKKFLVWVCVCMCSLTGNFKVPQIYPLLSLPSQNYVRLALAECMLYNLQVIQHVFLVKQEHSTNVYT